MCGVLGSVLIWCFGIFPKDRQIICTKQMWVSIHTVLKTINARVNCQIFYSPIIPRTRYNYFVIHDHTCETKCNSNVDILHTGSPYLCGQASRH